VFLREEEFRSAACWWIAGKVKKTLAIMQKTDYAAVQGRLRKTMQKKPEDKIPCVVSFGAGTNSTAILQGMLERNEKPDAILFADTGGEKPGTYKHLERMQRWCVESGFPELIVVRYSDTSRHASLEDECHNNGTLPSKAFGFGGCSQKWKRYPMDKWVKAWPEAQATWERGSKVQRVIGIHYGETRRGKIPDDEKSRTMKNSRIGFRSETGNGGRMNARPHVFGLSVTSRKSQRVSIVQRCENLKF
jgi:hypothetical protein